MAQMTGFRLFSTAAAGVLAGWGVGKLYPHINPAFRMDPRAVAIAAAIGALFYAASQAQTIMRCFTGEDSSAAKRKFVNDTIHWSVTGFATGVAYGVLKLSKFNSTIGQTMAGVFIGLGAKLVIDYFYLPANPSSKKSNQEQYH